MREMPRGCGAWRFRSGARLRRCVVAVWVIAAWVAAHLQSYALLADAMTVSRTFHDPPGPASWCHARFTSHQRHGARRLRLDQEDPNWISPTARPPTNRPARPRCLTKQSRMQFPTDTDRRHLRNRMISTFRFQNLKYWQGNCMRLLLSCTRQGALHPLRSITPDQNGCNAH